MKQETTLRLPHPIREAVKQMAELYGTTLNAIMTEALIEHLERKFGLIVRPQSAQSGVTFVVTTRAQTEPTERPQSAQTEPVVVAKCAQLGDIGGVVSFSGEETKKTKTTTTGGAGGIDPDFDAFYSAYPRKQKRPDALKAWGQTTPIRPALEVVLASVAKWSTSLQWTKDGGTFVPLPASWLRSESWNDVPAAGPPAKVDPRTLVELSPEWYAHQRATMRVVL